MRGSISEAFGLFWPPRFTGSGRSAFPPCFAHVSPFAFRPRSAPPPHTRKFRQHAVAGIFWTVRQWWSLSFGSRSSRKCALSRSCVPSSARISRGQPATSAARIAARRRVVAMAQVTHPAPGYLTRHHTDNRRAGTSSPDGWCSLLNGRHQSGTTISHPTRPVSSDAFDDRLGTWRAVAAATVEWLLSVRSTDLRRDGRQRARRAVS